MFNKPNKYFKINCIDNDITVKTNNHHFTLMVDGEVMSLKTEDTTPKKTTGTVVSSQNYTNRTK